MKPKQRKILQKIQILIRQNRALKIDLSIILITIIIPIAILISNLEASINIVPIFILLFLLFYFIDNHAHKLYLNKETKQEENKQEPLTFTKPVEGEIAKEYAKDKLVYSETLEEWATHLGWDIKADKTTVVKASANGKVKSIKNDPRYGLSIIIEHQDGYETLYASLLSTEFVTVGEEVKQGQSIGTVGNSAAFEVADAPHLHFEIIQNGESIDPSTFIK